uniref:Retinol dehydrogenase 14 n=1 Tax=Plectus sambesii TaxID=2011161 RepID=A0A914WY96_9BILA
MKRPAKVAYCNAHWLSHVKVLSKKTLNYTEAAYPMFTIYGIEHIHFYKAPKLSARSVTEFNPFVILTPAFESVCGLELSVGKHYLLTGVLANGFLKSTLCSQLHWSMVNFLAHFLLCTRLLGVLKGNQPSRVVVVSSVLHSWHSLDWDDPMAEHKYDKYLQYSRSKLMCHMFAMALHRHLGLDGRDYAVTVNLLEPGVIDTKLTRAAGKLPKGSTVAPVSTGSIAPVYLAQSAQVNHLAHFLLTNKLLDLLKSNQPARIVIVSSICYTWHSIEWEDLNSECDYEKYVQYSRTKLMNHLFAFALNRRLNSTTNSMVTCNVLEPGVIETKLLRNGGYSGSPVAEGARASVFLSQSDDVAKTTDCYFSNTAKQITASAESRDESLQDRLWDATVDILKQKNVW